MCPSSLCRFIRPLAVFLNIAGIGFLIFFMITELHRANEILIMMAVMVVPLVSLMALRDRLGYDERALMREVRMARLQKELAELQG